MKKIYIFGGLSVIFVFITVFFVSNNKPKKEIDQTGICTSDVLGCDTD